MAQITFGVWTKLLPTQDTKDPNYHGRQILWHQALRHAFPHRPANDPDGMIVSDRASRLHGLRNRVSHMEPLLNVHITARYPNPLTSKVAGYALPVESIPSFTTAVELVGELHRRLNE